MKKPFVLALLLLLSYFQIYAQNETIRSFTTGAFEVSNPQKAIVELGMNTSDYEPLYFNWLYTLNDNVAINFEIRPIGFRGASIFLSASFNLTNNFAIGPYIQFYESRWGLFGSYRANVYDLCFDIKFGGDFKIYSPPLKAYNFNYFLSLSTKKRISENLQLIGEVNYNSPPHNFDYINEFLLFSIGSQYKLFKSINIRAMIGFNSLSNSGNLIGKKLEGVIGINYVFE